MRWMPKDLTVWHTKFVWFPHTTCTGQCVWLEKVQRRLIPIGYGHSFWEYKTID